jgi:hypothetical protein|tara:strand:+ start:276 stop:725 length:450 start_codon:yes stop_codon:yes gene_type:complete
MAKKKTVKKKEAPFKEVTTGQEQPAKKGLLEELEDLRDAGETSTARYKEIMQEIEVIYGTGETNSFGTNDLEILKDKLNAMSKADLQAFARKVGINPYYNKGAVKDNIIKEFNRYQSRGNMASAPLPVPAIELDPNNPQHRQVLDWLEG